MSSYLDTFEPQNSQSEPTSCDACKPIRDAFSGFTKLFGKSKFITSMCILVPMVMMVYFYVYVEYGIQTLYFQGYPYEFDQLRTFFNPPLTLLASMTFVAGGVSLISLYCGFQNIVGVCSFVYSSIAYWALINTLIIVFCTWDYLNHQTIG